MARGLALAQSLVPGARVEIDNTLQDRPVELPKFVVGEEEEEEDEIYDATGMGSIEEDMRGAPFANDLTTVDFEMEDSLSSDLSTEFTRLRTATQRLFIAWRIRCWQTMAEA